jgi:hypothetical protein
MRPQMISNDENTEQIFLFAKNLVDEQMKKSGSLCDLKSGVRKLFKTSTLNVIIRYLKKLKIPI